MMSMENIYRRPRLGRARLMTKLKLAFVIGKGCLLLLKFRWLYEAVFYVCVPKGV